MRAATLALLALLVLTAPAGAVSRARSDKRAHRMLGGRYDKHRAPVHAYPGVLGPGTVISEPGPGHLVGRTRVEGGDGNTRLVTPLARKAIGHRARLYWQDLAPRAMFPHLSRLLLLDARHGKVLRRTTMAWWPLIGGKQFTPFASHTRAAPARRAAATPGAANSRIILIGDYGAKETGNDFAAWSKFALDRTGKTVIRTDDAAGLLAAMRDAYSEGARDVVIYVNGHQFAPVAFGHDYAGQIQDWVNRTFSGIPPGPYVSLDSDPGAGHTWKQKVLTGDDLKGAIGAAKSLFPDLTVSAVVEACGAGNFKDALAGVADRYVTSSGPGQDSYGPKGTGSAPSPFTSLVLDTVGKILDGSPQVDVSTALAAGEEDIVEKTPDVSRDAGAWFDQDPVVDKQVSGQIVSPGTTDCSAQNAYAQDGCTPPKGLIAVRLRVEFNVDGPGTVMVEPPGESVTTPGKNGDHMSSPERDLYFYVRSGGDVTVSATHGENAFFEGWQVHNGASCDAPYATDENPENGSPGKCVIPVSDPNGLQRFSEDIRAFFGTCPPPGHVPDHGGEHADCPG